jgi:hypothetical protein
VDVKVLYKYVKIINRHLFFLSLALPVGFLLEANRSVFL